VALTNAGYHQVADVCGVDQANQPWPQICLKEQQ